MAAPDPTPPPDLLAHVSGDPSSDNFVATFPRIRLHVRRLLGLAGFDFNAFANVLDLGCGVGRFLLAFEDELAPGQRLWGCDVHEPCARWCRDNVGFAEVVNNSIDPPLPYSDGQFDLVYALSVFTHLDLELQLRWAAEVHRILRPGGVLFASFHGPALFSYFQQQEHATRVLRLASIGDDGLFAYLAPPAPDSNTDGQVEVASAHSESAVREQFSFMRVVGRFPQGPLAAGQDIYIFQRDPNARPVAYATNKSQERSSRTDAPHVLDFTLDGHNLFKVYPTIRPGGMYPVVFEVEIGIRDGVLARARIPLNFRRVFENHHAVLSVPVPRFSGPVRVQLQTLFPGPEQPPSSVEVKWLVPRFQNARANEGSPNLTGMRGFPL